MLRIFPPIYFVKTPLSSPSGVSLSGSTYSATWSFLSSNFLLMSLALGLQARTAEVAASRVQIIVLIMMLIRSDCLSFHRSWILYPMFFAGAGWGIHCAPKRKAPDMTARAQISCAQVRDPQEYVHRPRLQLLASQKQNRSYLTTPPLPQSLIPMPMSRIWTEHT